MSADLEDDPVLLTADEPTGNLDTANGDAVMEMLMSLGRSGTTIVMVTHDPHAAARAGRTLNLEKGEEPPQE